MITQVGGGKTAEEMAEDVAKLFGGEKPDVTIECSGAEPSIRYGGCNKMNTLQCISIFDICSIGLEYSPLNPEAVWFWLVLESLRFPSPSSMLLSER